MIEPTDLPWSIGKITLTFDRGCEPVEVTQVGLFATEQDFEATVMAGPPCICMMWANGPDADAGLREANAMAIKQAMGALDVLRRLVTNPHLDLSDLVYTVRDHEGEGWHGPAVKAWSDAVSDARKLLDDSKRKET